jgi:hypothetical protein
VIGGGGLYGKPSAPIPYSPIPECKDKKRYRKKRKTNTNKC